MGKIPSFNVNGTIFATNNDKMIKIFIDWEGWNDIRIIHIPWIILISNCKVHVKLYYLTTINCFLIIFICNTYGKRRKIKLKFKTKSTITPTTPGTYRQQTHARPNSSPAPNSTKEWRFVVWNRKHYRTRNGFWCRFWNCTSSSQIIYGRIIPQSASSAGSSTTATTIPESLPSLGGQL